MTKERAPLSVHMALTEAVTTLGSWEPIRALTRRAIRTLQNWTDADTSAGVSLEHALAIDAQCISAGGVPHLYRWYGHRLDLHEAELRRDQATIIQSAIVAAKEFGEAQAATFAAIAPGARPADLLIAERETAQAYEAIGHQLQDLRAAAHPAGGPIS